MKIKSVKAVVLVPLLAAGISACTPFTKIEGEGDTITKINGSWTVMWSGGSKLEGVSPKPTIIFDTSRNTVSGFDGCNRYKGSYTFENGLLKANVASTRMACRSPAARAVSAQIANLFSNGAQVVETAIMKGRVLMLKNSSAEVRLGPSEHVK